jgi:hypothetical protein
MKGKSNWIVSIWKFYIWWISKYCIKKTWIGIKLEEYVENDSKDKAKSVKFCKIVTKKYKNEWIKK